MVQWGLIDLFNFIKERLPAGFGLGDDGTVYENKEPNHKTWKQTIREDHEGDVGVFEIYRSEQTKYNGHDCFVSEMQIAVVTNQGDIDSAMDYLYKTYKNIQKNNMSEHIWVKQCKLIKLVPLGKNSNGYQMVELGLLIKYLVDKED